MILITFWTRSAEWNSLLSAQLGYRGNHILHTYGVEYNPFVRFVAQAKLSWPDYRLDRIAKLIPGFWLLASPSLAQRMRYLD